ncbi:serine protease SP24D-like [Calliphora vicina]|uniref:serine protease SP24D-like n=1 Tax=Calliphora vicina TaxID=7373 RepID=UPI00325A764B
MKLNIFVKYIIHLFWIFYAAADLFDGDDDSNFVPITQQPLVYFPQPRIVGGKNAKENQFPYQISLRYYNQHICGGSIISKNYVVTAAHCVTTVSGSTIKKTPVSIITIRAGSREVDSGGVTVGVSQVNVHPNYRNFNNDIAVVKLSKPLELNGSIQPIALATKSLKPGVKVVTTGWGRLRTGGDTPQILQFNTLISISNAECKRRIGNVATSTLCLSHTVGNGVCNGDSGGPAVYKNQLVGVTNFVVGGCGSNAPDGYASVAFYSSWIRSNTDLK